MSKPSFAHFLISSAAMGRIGMFWFEVTRNAVKKVMQLYNEMFADKGAEERERQREIQEEVRRRVSEILREEQEEEEAAGKED